MRMTAVLKWAAGAVLTSVLLTVLFIAIFGWNWLRGPIERYVQAKTGRALVIQGDLKVHIGWPRPHLSAELVSFANPAWAQKSQMLQTDAINVTVDMLELLHRKLVLPEVHLTRPVINLQQGSMGRQSWLLDLNQTDPAAALIVGHLTLDEGRLGFDDAQQKTHIQATFSTTKNTASESELGLIFTAQGQYKGAALKAAGRGGPVLALRDQATAYPVTVDASFGKTRVQAKGGITGLTPPAALDMQVKLSGDTLDALYPLIGIALPTTRPYKAQGHLLYSGKLWRFQDFSGLIGASDIAGAFRVNIAGDRPVLGAELRSKVLDIADLGPLIGAKPGQISVAQDALQKTAPATAVVMGKITPIAATPSKARVLPDIPFKTDRWGSMDADVSYRAATLRRSQALPLENLSTNLTLRDSVLTLNPLNFGLAGGELTSVITLDGRKNPLQGSAKIRAKKVVLSKLFPTVDLNKNSIGQINGETDFTGQGNSVSGMLATANGKLNVVVAGGAISKLMMERLGLHLWEILQINLTHDRLVALRCAAADFDIEQGVMGVKTMVMDTEVTTVMGSGAINLRDETVDLTLKPKTKATSPLALRSPIYLRGSFVKPVASVDKGKVVARVVGAVALGLVNPILAVIPLIDAGPGKDSDCAQLIRKTKAPSPATPEPNSAGRSMAR